MVQKDTHHVEPYVGGPAELFIDNDGVKGVLLPHFKLIDGVARGIIETHRPGQLVVPRCSAGY